MSVVGTAELRIIFNEGSLTASMDSAEKTVKSKGESMGKMGGEGLSKGWAVGIAAIGKITETAIETAAKILTSGIDDAIKRVDTMNNFPRVMENLGIEASKSEAIIKDLGKRLKGLPTTLNAAASSVQRFTAANGDIKKSEEYFLALNNALLAGGASMDIQQTALEQLSQAYAKGRPDMMEWRSVMTAMPAQLKQLAQAMNYPSTDALGEALRKGEVSMDAFMGKMAEMNKSGSGEFKSFEEQAKNATDGIQTAQANLNTAMARGWAKILDAIGSKKIASALSKVGEALEGLLNVIAGIIDFIANNEVALDVFKAVLIVIGAVVAGVVVPAFVAWAAALLANPITWIIAAVIALITGLIMLVEHIDEVGEWFRNVFNGIQTALADFSAAAMKVIDGFAQAFWNAIENVKNWFASIPAFFGSVFAKIGDLFRGIGTKIGEIVSGAFKAVVNGILSFIEGFLNAPIDAINGLIGTINIIPGVDIPTLGRINLPRLAKGGLVTGSTLANIGEQGNEAVIPLEQNTENWARPLAQAIAEQFQAQNLAGAGITVYMTNNINNNLDADEIGQRLMTSIRRAA